MTFLQRQATVLYQKYIDILSIIIASSVVELLKLQACDQHGFGSKPTCTILLVLGKDTLQHIPLLGGLGKQF